MCTVYMFPLLCFSIFFCCTYSKQGGMNFDRLFGTHTFSSSHTLYLCIYTTQKIFPNINSMYFGWINDAFVVICFASSDFQFLLFFFDSANRWSAWMTLEMLNLLAFTISPVVSNHHITIWQLVSETEWI